VEQFVLEVEAASLDRAHKRVEAAPRPLVPALGVEVPPPAAAPPAATPPVAAAVQLNPPPAAPAHTVAKPAAAPTVHHRRNLWWLWTTIAVVVAGGAAVGIGLALAPRDASVPSSSLGAMSITLR
jgi:hypothetical protein